MGTTCVLSTFACPSCCVCRQPATSSATCSAHHPSQPKSRTGVRFVTPLVEERVAIHGRTYYSQIAKCRQQD
eukprot:6730177-Prymnesium_polylepis.2